MLIPFVKLDEKAISPTHNHTGDAGLDFYSLEHYLINKHSFKVVKTGITVQLPEGYVGLLFPKGGNNHLLGAGVIDTFYEGEVLFKIANFRDSLMVVHEGDPIGQMIIVPFVEPMPVKVQRLFNRSKGRGDSGGIKATLTVDGDVTDLACGVDTKNLEKFIGEEISGFLDNTPLAMV